MKPIRFFLIVLLATLLGSCGSDFQRAEKLYQKSQSEPAELSAALEDPLSEAIDILEGYLSRNADDAAGTLLLWRCYLRAAHPRAQAMHEAMLRMPERMYKILPGEIRNEQDAQMRERMVYLLGEITKGQPVAPLIKILEKDSKVNVQRAAAEVLARLGNADAVPALLRKLLDENPAVRYFACRALASFPRPEVATVLFARLQDTAEEPDVRHQAAQSLAAIGLADFSGKAALVQQLEQLLQNSTYPVSTQLLAGSALAVLGNRAGFDLAMRHVTSKDVYLQGLAIITLGFIGDKKALPFLAEALQNGSKALRLYAAEALGRIGDIKALPSLYKALDDPHEAVREAARQSINKIRTLEKSG